MVKALECANETKWILPRTTSEQFWLVCHGVYMALILVAMWRQKHNCV